MARYSITVSIEATRLDDPPPMKTRDPGADPHAELIDKANEFLAALPSVGMAVNSHVGFSRTNHSRTATITAESFAELAVCLGRFDDLVESIELDSEARR